MRRRFDGPPCPHNPSLFKTEAAHVAHKESQRRWDEKQRQIKGTRQFEADGYPLRLRLQRLLACIKQRCQRKRYAARGVICLLTIDDLAILWVQYNADRLQRPSIDRIDNDGSYTRQNCRFIELAENVRRGIKVRDEERVGMTISESIQ